jgi:hypothetical protein
MKKIFYTICFLFISTLQATAQCAMCKATVENSLEAKANEANVSLNSGILYLMITPYLAIGAIALLWYRSSKEYTKKQNALSKIKKNGLRIS